MLPPMPRRPCGSCPSWRSELKRFPKLWDIFVKIEMPLIGCWPIWKWPASALDKKFFAAFALELNERLAALEKEIYAAVGKTFNINSTQQLSSVLFDTAQTGTARPRQGRPPPAIIPPPLVCWMN